MESYQFLIHREKSSNQYSVLSHEVSPEMSNSVTNTLQSQSNAAFERTSSIEEDSPASLVDSCSDGSETFDHSCNMFASDVSVCSEKFVVDDEEDEDGYRGGNSCTSSSDGKLLMVKNTNLCGYCDLCFLRKTLIGKQIMIFFLI